MKKQLITFSLLFISTSILSQVRVTTNFREFEGENYSINYLSPWSLIPESNAASSQEFQIFAEANSSELDKVRESVRLLITAHNREKTMSTYVVGFIKRLKKRHKSTKFLTNQGYYVKSTSFNEYVHELVYTVNSDNKIGKEKIIFFKRDDKIYVFIYSSSETEYNKYLTSADFIIQSFSFK